MARKRMIDPEFWSDEEIGQWSHSARLFYIALWNFSDDEGRFKAHDNLLKSEIFPYDDQVDIENLKKEINGKIQWYEIEGLKYGFVRNFLKHQSLDRPKKSKLPPPPEESTTNRRLIDDSSTLKEKKRKEENRIYVDFEKSTQATWNAFCDKHPSLSKIKVMTETRRKALEKRFSENTFVNFPEIIAAIEEQPFLIQGNPDNKEHKGWKVGFDWLIENDTNYVKVLERKYKDSLPKYALV